MNRKSLDEATRKLESIYSVAIIAQYASRNSQYLRNLLKENDFPLTTNKINVFSYGKQREIIDESMKSQRMSLPNDRLKLIELTVTNISILRIFDCK